MMRRWTPPRTWCIFCAFARTRSSAGVQRCFRAGYTTASRHNEHKDPVIIRKFDPEEYRIKARQRTQPAGRDTSLSRHVNLSHIDGELQAVRLRLIQNSYDCEGRLWHSFREKFMHIATEDPHNLTKRQASLRTSLERARLEGVADAFLQSMFIDEYLESQGHNIGGQLARVADLRYPTEWYTKARSTQRDIHLHIGPTNSGKTYNALKRLEEAGSGFYAGPLRLLAHEVYSRFQAKGIKCDLITGDDVRIDGDGANLKASTVEMTNVNSSIEVAVIDEIQMMSDPERGWAWTRAFLGTCAQEVHLCGENRVKPLVQELAASMGDKLHVHEYKRLNELRCMSTSLEGDLNKLQPGDAVIVFSIVGIHAMKKEIERRTRRRCAVVYGSLPPETRAQQAALFNEPDNEYDFLVASDAVGMGLNLSIKRIIFESLQKFDGLQQQQLSVSAIKQIAGRAGRYRTARDAAVCEIASRKRSKEKSVGLVTTLLKDDLPIVRAALAAEAEPITTASIMPPGEFVVDLAARLPENTPHEYILQRLSEAAAVHPRFALSNLRSQSELARIIQPVPSLSTEERHVFTAAPFSFRKAHKGPGSDLAYELAEYLGQKKPVSVVDVKGIPLEMLQQPLHDDRAFLHELEYLHQALILYLWLSYRMSTVFQDQAMAFHAKTMVEDRINLYLETYTSANTRARVRSHLSGKGFGLEQLSERNSSPRDLARQMHHKKTSLSRQMDLNSLDSKASDAHAGVGAEMLDPLPTADPGVEPALPTSWDHRSGAVPGEEPAYDGTEQQHARAAGSG